MIEGLESLLELIKIEMLELKNKPQSKDDIMARMARWGSGEIYATFDYAVNNGLLRPGKTRILDVSKTRLLGNDCKVSIRCLSANRRADSKHGKYLG